MIRSSKFCNKYMKSGFFSISVVDLSLLDKHTLHQLRYLQKKAKTWRVQQLNKPVEYRCHIADFVSDYLDSHPTFAHRMGLMSFKQYANFMQDQADNDKARGDTDSYNADVDGGLGTMDYYSVFISPRTDGSSWIGDDDGTDAESLLDRLGLGDEYSMPA